MKIERWSPEVTRQKEGEVFKQRLEQAKKYIPHITLRNLVGAGGVVLGALGIKSLIEGNQALKELSSPLPPAISAEAAINIKQQRLSKPEEATGWGNDLLKQLGDGYSIEDNTIWYKSPDANDSVRKVVLMDLNSRGAMIQYAPIAKELQTSDDFSPEGGRETVRFVKPNHLSVLPERQLVGVSNYDQRVFTFDTVNGRWMESLGSNVVAGYVDGKNGSKTIKVYDKSDNFEEVDSGYKIDSTGALVHSSDDRILGVNQQLSVYESGKDNALMGIETFPEYTEGLSPQEKLEAQKLEARLAAKVKDDMGKNGNMEVLVLLGEKRNTALALAWEVDGDRIGRREVLVEEPDKNQGEKLVGIPLYREFENGIWVVGSESVGYDNMFTYLTNTGWYFKAPNADEKLGYVPISRKVFDRMASFLTGMVSQAGNS